MSYSIRIKESAAKELARVSQKDRVRIIHAIDHLREHPLTGSSLKGEYRGIRRIRVGEYRVLYEVGVEELIILYSTRSHTRGSLQASMTSHHIDSETHKDTR